MSSTTTNTPLWLPTQQNHHKSDGEILIVAVLSLIFVVALVILLHLYVLCLLRRRRHVVTAPLSIPSTSPAPGPTGLDPSLIPAFAYRKDTASLTIECSVCLSQVEEGEMVKVLPKCKHGFHVGCVDMWLSSHTTCPMCRATVEPLMKDEVDGATGAPLGSKEGGTSSGVGSRLGASLRRMLSGREWEGRIGVHGDGGAEDIERQ